MAQIIEQNDIFGKIGKGFGQGLSEQIPKEIEHQRLSAGLKKLGETEGLTPRQFWTQANSIYGISPEQQRQAGEFARSEARGQALKDNNQPKPSPFPNSAKKPSVSSSDIPSITREDPLAESIKGYIPPTQEEIYSKAGEEYNANPAKFNHDPQKAIEYSEKSAEQDRIRNEAFQKQHQKLSDIQDNVKDRLKNHSENLGVKIPANTYSKIEDEAIQATKPKSLGGRGLTEQQAMKEYGKKLDAASRNYQSVQDNVNGWGITGRKSNETLSALKSLQKDFRKNGDTENFGDTLTSKGSLSPIMAYSIAEPISDYPKVNSFLKETPELKKPPFQPSIIPNLEEKTLKLSQKIAPLIASSGASPLSVAYELEKKNYDPKVFLQYLTDHRDELSFKENQGRQLDKPRNVFGTINDWWLQSWSGIQ